MESRRLVTRKSALRIMALTGVALLMGGCEAFIREAESESRRRRWDEEDRRTHGEGEGKGGDGKSEK